MEDRRAEYKDADVIPAQKRQPVAQHGQCPCDRDSPLTLQYCSHLTTQYFPMESQTALEIVAVVAIVVCWLSDEQRQWHTLAQSIDDRRAEAVDV